MAKAATMNTHKIVFILSFIVCVTTWFIYHFIHNRNGLLDIPAHFAGGVSVIIVILYVSNITKLNSRYLTIIMLFIVCIIWEILEGSYALIEKLTWSLSDTAKDIVVGFIGGCTYLLSEVKHFL
jgi:hypothetical protein